MGTHHRFIASPSAPSEVMDWFESLSTEIAAVPTEYGYVLYFREMGPLSHLPDGSIDADSSPVVTIVFPQVRRNILWTIGEVTFRPTPLRKKFPELHKINSALSKWLSSLECVFSNKRHENPYSYYLEGSAQNYDAPIYAFSSGLEALKKEHYFVSHLDNQLRLDTLCKTLRLRGVECGAA